MQEYTRSIMFTDIVFRYGDVTQPRRIIFSSPAARSYERSQCDQVGSSGEFPRLLLRRHDAEDLEHEAGLLRP